MWGSRSLRIQKCGARFIQIYSKMWMKYHQYDKSVTARSLVENVEGEQHTRSELCSTLGSVMRAVYIVVIKSSLVHAQNVASAATTERLR